MPGSFSGLDSVRQGTGLEPRTLRAGGGGGDKGSVDPIQSSLYSPPRNFPLEVLAQASLSSSGISGCSRQSAACPKGAGDLAPLCMLGDAPLTSLGAGPGGPPPSLHPAQPWSHCRWGASGRRSPTPEGWQERAPPAPSREAQGLGSGWGLPGPCHSGG